MATRLVLANRLGILRLVGPDERGAPVTQGEAHLAILDALYDPVTGELRDVGPAAAVASDG